MVILIFEVVFILKVIFIFEVIFIFLVVFIFEFLFIFEVVFILRSSSFWGCLLNLLNEYTKFAYYGTKIRLETPEIKILSVALLSQAKQSECGFAHFLRLVSFQIAWRWSNIISSNFFQLNFINILSLALLSSSLFCTFLFWWLPKFMMSEVI